ncbi:hypothetical protein [Myxococcus xanthus]|uniref:hypothetical protein n=1 Tax=Myxococcus xanthus TaxID=34 RepID=UPI00031B0DA1|nr:hypothetical protein [Myxococcus xanthus]NOJ55957.1 hypothetical protein [Myxococcus xanthus]QPM78616.1 hypothetical protein I5Q59_30815 [Myxococcus xanthus]QVW67686.1 hypothetical protein JTM82_36165 [Myxococcus xanthus DZ2]QZZ53875.1 hypothetical protein MyxoNM_32095 [Myxococcus xanthus]UEO06190.1 hypothetical protein K1515_06625 [Myxococcus xanthus DZ2]
MKATWRPGSALLTEAKRLHPPRVGFDPDAVAWMLYSTWQGSMLVGKTRQRPEMVIENLRQMRTYFQAIQARLTPGAS